MAERLLRGVLTGVVRLAVGGIAVVVVVIIVAIAASSGGDGGGPQQPQANKAVIARVGGTPGIKFSGDVGTADRDRSVEGTVPQDYPIKGFDTSNTSIDVLSMVMQKSGKGGKLTCQVVLGRKVVKSDSTTARYGTCTITWSPTGL